MKIKMGWAAVVAVSLGLGAAAQPPAPKRAMTFADLMAMKRVSDPQISPSGKWVMFGVTDVSLEKNTKVNHLWVVPLEGGGGTNAGILPSGQNDRQERQVTFGDGESGGRFSPDGKWVSYSAKDQIYLAAWDEVAGKVGAAKQLTSVSTGADGGVWSPDSKRVMFVSSVYPECSVKGVESGGGTKTNSGVSPLRSAPVEMTPSRVGPGVVIGGTLNAAAWTHSEPASWAEEETCDKAKDAAAAATPVKGQVWEGLLYRHWDHYVGAQRSHVLVVSADGTGVRDLTPACAVGDAETPTFFVGGVQNYAWAPDSKEIAYVTNLDAVPAASTNNDVFTLRLDEPGAKAVKVSTSPGSDDGPAYSPDGKWLAWRSQARGGFESDKFRLVVMDRETKTIKDLIPKFDDWVDEFAWAPNSSFILFTGSHQGESPLRLVAIQEHVESSGDFETRTRPETGEFSDLRLADGVGIVAMRMTIDHPSEVVRIPEQKYDSAGNFVGGQQMAKLSHVNDQIFARLDVAPLEPFWFTGAEGTKVEGFLMKPPNFDPAKKYPVKFLMHGGPQTAWGDAWSYRWNWELMAASGYVVIGINRRGSTGYGQKFVDEVSGDWGGRAYEDLMKGLDYAEAHYSFLDKNRECALGASYGGFMANWVLTHTNRFKCIVTHDGMYDPVSAWGDTEEMWFNEWEFRRPEDFPKGWDGFSAGYDPLGHRAKANAGVSPRPAASGRDDASVGGGGGAKANAGVSPLRSAPVEMTASGAAGHPAEPWRYQNLPADQDPFRKWAPMRFIENAKTPTLVIHSQRDMRLDVSQGMEMFGALQRLGVPSKMLYFPDEGHWVLKPQNSQLWNEVVGDWCDRWTKTGKYAAK
ncbi:MAG TPA: S9 family peptidase [Acidobacteriaceae bacterium]